MPGGLLNPFPDFTVAGIGHARVFLGSVDALLGLVPAIDFALDVGQPAFLQLLLQLSLRLTGRATPGLSRVEALRQCFGQVFFNAGEMRQVGADVA